jgi:hypothetical protein
MEFRSRRSSCPGRHDGNRAGVLLASQQGRQPGWAAPVVTDKANTVELKLINQGYEIRCVVIQAVSAGAVRML